MLSSGETQSFAFLFF